jgi:hypothetical protein
MILTMGAGGAIAVDTTVALDDLVIATNVVRHVVRQPSATPNVGIPDAIASTRGRGATEIARAIPIGATNATAASETIDAATARTAFAFDDVTVAAIVRVAVVRLRAATTLALICETRAAADTKGATDLTGAIAAGATLATAAFESFGA